MKLDVETILLIVLLVISIVIVIHLIIILLVLNDLFSIIENISKALLRPGNLHIVVNYL